jgi:hypothetical protein
MLLTPVSLSRLNAHWSYWVLLMRFTLQRTTLAALSSSSFQSDLEAQPHQPMHPEAADRLVSFLAVCKLSHMFLNLLVATMAILIIIVGSTEAIIHLAILTASHTLKVASLPSSNLRCQYTMADPQQLEAMEVSDHSSRSKLAMLFLKTMLDLLLNQCKAWFLDNH